MTGTKRSGDEMSISSAVRVATSGAIAHIVEAMIMHPLDTVKTRFQLDQASSTTKRPVITTLGQLAKEGGVHRLWRGCLPAVGMQAPRGMVKFTVNWAVGVVATAQGWNPHLKGFMTGMCAGVTESLIITPFEHMKVRLQSPTYKTAYKNTFHAVKEVCVQSGTITVLWRGLCVTAIRNGAWNAVYFGLIGLFSSASSFQGSQPPWASFVYGTLAGGIGAFFSNPWDVVKSRIQSMDIPNSSTAKSVHAPRALPLLIHIARTEGYITLYRGMVPKLWRLGPGGGLLLYVFDNVSKLLSTNKS